MFPVGVADPTLVFISTLTHNKVNGSTLQTKTIPDSVFEVTSVREMEKFRGVHETNKCRRTCGSLRNIIDLQATTFIRWRLYAGCCGSKDIIEFAGIDDFIDKPVRTYSSGMYSKLAFSITAILETEIMLIDEVLSVGDQQFRKKSYNKMKELISKRDRTVVIVSHSMSTLADLCDRLIWLHDGEIIMYDTPEIVLPVYQDFMR